MKKRTIVLIAALVLCLVAVQGVFADDVVYPTYFRQFEVRSEEEGYTLEEAFWFNPTIYCIDVLQFTQVYMMPDDPVSFYMSAAEYTDEQIEDNYIIFQSFIEPAYVGMVDFKNSCDVEAYAESLGYEFDPSVSYGFDILFEDLSAVTELFPRGIGRTSAYNTYRRTALQLAFYAAKHGKTPGADVISNYLTQIFEYYERQYEEAMEAEAALMETETVEIQ